MINLNKISTLENEIKTLQRTILEIMPSKHNKYTSGEMFGNDRRLEMIAEISKIIEIKTKKYLEMNPFVKLEKCEICSKSITKEEQEFSDICDDCRE